GKGDFEPNMKRDIGDGWMYTATDTSSSQAVRQVYLNGFASQCAETCTAVNPNVATARSEFFTADINFKAMFGVWKDCNKDGYIGLGDQGLFEYRTELLLDVSVCPKQTTPTPIPAIWMPSHNDGTWVREYIAINWLNKISVVGDMNKWNINDNKARVWADYGLPETAYLPTCPLIPVERGTLHTTGGMLHAFDCREGYTVTSTFNGVADSNAALRPYSFSDHPRDQQNSASQANIKNPWGDQSDASNAQVWDCGQPQVTSVAIGKDPVIGGYMRVNVSMPKVPPGVTPGGSAAGTMNATGSGFDKCSRDTDHPSANSPDGLIYEDSGGYYHWGATMANTPYWLEYDVAGTPTKVQADDNLEPGEGTRPAVPFAAVLGQSTPAPGDVAEIVAGDGIWGATTQWTNPFFLQRYTLQTGPVPHTFYGYVSSDAIRDYGLSVPKGASIGTYGKEACGAIPGYNPVTNWQCNRAAWYIDSNGKDFDSRNARLGPDPTPPAGAGCNVNDASGCLRYGSRAGDPYNLRDIDCYDESVQQARAAGIGYGVVTSQKCDANNA
ncbi:MAG: hypothetical protein WDA16_07740, partial [Candidatus Thermoplasmatota archaeon]